MSGEPPTKHHCRVPILFLIFNRPQTTDRVFEAIRRARPEKLYIAADGPRTHIPDDDTNCALARDIATSVDWSCRVRTRFLQENAGCQLAVSSAITWFFEHEQEGIILEDDCLPDQTFFLYCEELLDRYRDDHRIFAISGSNFQSETDSVDGSYYFSCFNHCWGWATWKRAWKYFDFEMELWPKYKSDGLLSEVFENRIYREYWEDCFDEVFAEKINSWSYRWTFAAWANSALSVLPAKNLVMNIGLGASATHTVSHIHQNRISALDFPLRHPAVMKRSIPADISSMHRHFNVRLTPYIKRRMKKRWHRLKQAFLSSISY